MIAYHKLLNHILLDGSTKQDRTGTGTLSVFGYQMSFSLEHNVLPVVTTKRIHLKSVIEELLWFLSGSTNNNDLKARGVSIWDEWAGPDGELGPIYSKQWTSWAAPDGEVINQIANVVESIKTNPDSRRHIVTAWNPADIDDMALPPCHCLFQFYVQGDKLSCQLYQRSGDAFLGIPFNITSYALLTHMVAHVTGLKPHRFVHTIGDAHLYLNHIDQAKEQLERTPRAMPTVELNPRIKNIFDFTSEDIRVLDYDPHPAIKAPVAV